MLDATLQTLFIRGIYISLDGEVTNVCMLIQISEKFVPTGRVYNMAALVLEMDGCPVRDK